MKNLFFRFIVPTIFIAIFCIYFYMLAPSVPAQGDSGELITVAKILGIAHPPGYPIFTIVGHLFTYLPFNSIAWRVNLMAATSHIFTLVLLYKSLVIFTKNKLISLVSIGVLAFSYTFWLYSLVAEVFSLNDLFVCLLIWLVVSRKPLWQVAMVLGFGMSNHQTIILVTPALLYFYVKEKLVSTLVDLRLILKVSLALLIGLTPYLYLLFRCLYSKPVVAWRSVLTLSDLFKMFFRSDYGSISHTLAISPSNATFFGRIDQIVVFFDFLKDDFNSFVIFVSALSIGLIMFRRLRSQILFPMIAFVFTGPLFLAYGNLPFYESLTMLQITERFYLLPAIFLIIIFAMCLNFIINRISRISKVMVFPIYILCFLAIFQQLTSNWSLVNQRENYLAINYSKNLLTNVDQDGVLILKNDISIFTSFYLHYAEGYRPDINLLAPLSFKNLSNFIDRTIDKHKIYSNSDLKLDPEVFISSPAGILFLIKRSSSSASFKDWKSQNEIFWSKVQLPDKAAAIKFSNLTDTAVLSLYAELLLDSSVKCFENGDISCSIDYAQKALDVLPQAQYTNYYLARAYKSAGDCSQSDHYYQIAINYNKRAVYIYDDLFDLAKNCFHDDVLAKRYLDMKNEILKK